MWIIALLLDGNKFYWSGWYWTSAREKAHEYTTLRAAEVTAADIGGFIEHA